MNEHEELMLRVRRIATLLVKLSDEVNAVAGEFAYRQLATLSPEEGGLNGDYFTGAHSRLTREDTLALMALLHDLFGPLTDEQRALFYRMKGTAPMFARLTPLL